MKHYVVGFAFYGTSVLLVRKKNPEWQQGKWNGVGGKMEDEDKLPIITMQREFKEEAGIDTDWTHTATLVIPGGGTLAVFRAYLTDKQANDLNITNDVGELLELHKVNELPANMMYNLFWLIPLQLAKINWPVLIEEHVSVMKEVT